MFYAIIKMNDGEVKIWKTYDDEHVWDSPIYEVFGYSSDWKGARKMAAEASAEAEAEAIERGVRYPAL